MDTLGYLGLLGGLFIFNVLHIVKKIQFKKMPGRDNYTLAFMWASMSIFAVINTVFTSNSLSVIIFPFALCYAELTQSKILSFRKEEQ